MKSAHGYYFASQPGNHLSIKKSLEEAFGTDLQSCGGSFLALFPGNELVLDTGSKSRDVGPLTISWSLAKKMLQESVGASYTVKLSDEDE